MVGLSQMSSRFEELADSFCFWKTFGKVHAQDCQTLSDLTGVSWKPERCYGYEDAISDVYHAKIDVVTASKLAQELNKVVSKGGFISSTLFHVNDYKNAGSEIAIDIDTCRTWMSRPDFSKDDVRQAAAVALSKKPGTPANPVYGKKEEFSPKR